MSRASPPLPRRNGTSLRLVRPASREQWREARRLVEEYAATLGVDLSFQDFSREVGDLAAAYGPPGGDFLLAEEDGRFLGCAGLRRFSEGVGEMKRLYAVPAARGRGAGRLLAEGIVAAARERGYA
ncbi:MAG: GNAT family N-acetyltransferase, partial [Planctomycetaceae bacterium]|nr:GNAT family N-acetyltransferase [Planctomycetaceae bacterium]